MAQRIKIQELHFARSFIQLSTKAKDDKLNGSMTFRELLDRGSAFYGAAERHFKNGDEELAFTLYFQFKSAVLRMRKTTEYRENRARFEKRLSLKLKLARKRLRVLTVSLQGRYKELNSMPNSDFTIVAKNGTEYHLNREVVYKKIPIVEVKLTKPGQKTVASRIKLRISEDCLFVLMSYICDDDPTWWKGMVDTSQLAWELIEIAINMDISPFWLEVIQLVLTKPYEWLTMPVAVSLFGVASCIGNTRLQRKVLRTLRKKRDEVSQSVVYRKLKRHTPDVAKRLLNALN